MLQITAEKVKYDISWNPQVTERLVDLETV